MRALVLGDSHGVLDFALRAVKEAGKVDFLLHTGDFYRDGIQLAAATGIPSRTVAGNSDGRSEGPGEEVVELNGRKILLTHGHRLGIKFSLVKLVARGLELGADAVIYGHTHAANIEREGRLLLFNPGSISLPRDQGRPSYGILEITREGIIPYIFRL